MSAVVATRKPGHPTSRVVEVIVRDGLRTYVLDCDGIEHRKTIPNSGVERANVVCTICHPRKIRVQQETKIGRRGVKRTARRDAGCTCPRRCRRGCPAYVNVPWSKGKKARAA